MADEVPRDDRPAVLLVGGLGAVSRFLSYKSRWTVADIRYQDTSGASWPTIYTQTNSAPRFDWLIKSYRNSPASLQSFWKYVLLRISCKPTPVVNVRQSLADMHLCAISSFVSFHTYLSNNSPYCLYLKSFDIAHQTGRILVQDIHPSLLSTF